MRIPDCHDRNSREVPAAEEAEALSCDQFRKSACTSHYCASRMRVNFEQAGVNMATLQSIHKLARMSLFSSN